MLNLYSRKNCSNEIKVYADADFGGDDESLSTSGVTTFYAGNLIGWSSVKQRLVALSTCEAEINAIVEGATEAMYYRELLSELLQQEPVQATMIYNDNEPALETITKGGKHYKRRIDYLKKLMKLGELDISHVGTTEMPADAFTKTLPESQFLYLMSKCGLKFESEH